MKRHRIYMLSPLLIAASLGVSHASTEGQKAPMPQTRGMQGMDPAIHDQKTPDPYKDCRLNAEKAKQMKDHPMPNTKGMAGMDPKAHQMDCPDAPPVTPNHKPAHVHKGPGG